MNFWKFFACEIVDSIRARIKGVTQSVASEVEGEEHGDERGGGEDDHPPVDANGIDLRGAFGEEGAEAGLGRLDAETEITEEGFVKNDAGDGEGEIDNDDAVNVRENVAEDDAGVAGAEGARGVDKSTIAEGEYLAADDARHREPGDGAEAEEEEEEAREIGAFGREARGEPVFEESFEGGN